jgi:phenylacetic acid degradation operon negative regulatory protein
MKPKTELFLYHLCWGAELLMRPTFRNLEQGFESWAYANRLLDRVHELEAAGFLERNPRSDPAKSCLRLTDAALDRSRSMAQRFRAQKRKWNRTWHLLLFDLPATERSLRKSMHRALRQQGFGLLQGSVWIHPQPNRAFLREMNRQQDRPRDLILLESTSKGRNADRLLVQDAWNWQDIEQKTDIYRQHLRAVPSVPDTAELLAWAHRDARLWGRVLQADPLLPRCLWPDGYQGHDVFRQRMQILRRVRFHTGYLISGKDPGR